MKNEKVSGKDLEKVKNKTESAMAFEDMSVMNRAQSIAMYELLGDANLINSELSKYQEVTAEQILEECRIIFDNNNCSTMYYLSDNSNLQDQLTDEETEASIEEEESNQ